MLTPEQAREQMKANTKACMRAETDEQARFVERCLAYATDPEATQIARVMADQGMEPTGNENY